jgi:Domain of unknown function (DUF4352)
VDTCVHAGPGSHHPLFGENHVTQQPYAPPQGQPPYPQPPYPQPPYPQQSYGQAPQGQPPFGPPQQQGPQKTPLWKKTWFRVVAGLFIIAIIGSQLGGGDKSNDTTASGNSDAPAAVDSAAPAEEAAPEPATPGLNQPAADGKFSFVVSGVDCSLTRIGNEYFGTEAQGQFCVVSVAVTNIGDAPQGFFGDNAKLFNAEGQEFAADGEAAIYLEEADSIYTEINPGNTLQSKVVFDVPAGTTPATIELHDSAFSGGVTVKLQ